MILNKIQPEEVHRLRRFINRYNSIGYGNVKVVEVNNKIIIELYNAGFSENEEIEQIYFNKKHPSINLVVIDHPCHVLCIYTTFHEYKNKGLFDPIRELECYKKVNKYNYNFEVEG